MRVEGCWGVAGCVVVDVSREWRVSLLGTSCWKREGERESKSDKLNASRLFRTNTARGKTTVWAKTRTRRDETRGASVLSSALASPTTDNRQPRQDSVTYSTPQVPLVSQVTYRSGADPCHPLFSPHSPLLHSSPFATMEPNPTLFNDITFYINDSLSPLVQQKVSSHSLTSPRASSDSSSTRRVPLLLLLLQLRTLLVDNGAKETASLSISESGKRFDEKDVTHFVTDSLDFPEFGLLRPASGGTGAAAGVANGKGKEDRDGTEVKIVLVSPCKSCSEVMSSGGRA